jgi:hypothetical protein
MFASKRDLRTLVYLFFLQRQMKRQDELAPVGAQRSSTVNRIKEDLWPNDGKKPESKGPLANGFFVPRLDRK